MKTESRLLMDCATPNQDIMSVASPLHSSSRRVTRHAAQTERCVVRSRDRSILLVSPGGLDDVALTGVGLVRELPEEPGVAVLVHVPPLEGRHALQRLPFGRLGAAHRPAPRSALRARSSRLRLRRSLRLVQKPNLAGEPGVAASRYTLTTYGSTSGITLCAKTAALPVRTARASCLLER